MRSCRLRNQSRVGTVLLIYPKLAAAELALIWNEVVEMVPARQKGLLIAAREEAFIMNKFPVDALGLDRAGAGPGICGSASNTYQPAFVGETTGYTVPLASPLVLEWSAKRRNAGQGTRVKPLSWRACTTGWGTAAEA